MKTTLIATAVITMLLSGCGASESYTDLVSLVEVEQAKLDELVKQQGFAENRKRLDLDEIEYQIDQIRANAEDEIGKAQINIMNKYGALGSETDARINHYIDARINKMGKDLDSLDVVNRRIKINNEFNEENDRLDYQISDQQSVVVKATVRRDNAKP